MAISARQKKLALWLFALCMSACAWPATQAPKFILGLASSINDSPAVVSVAKWSGATSIRVDAPWSQIELAPGVYKVPSWLDTQLNAYEKAGISPLLILAYGNPIYQIKKPLDDISRERFSAYAVWLVKQLRGRVTHFQIWNEWETRTGGSEPGSAEDYLRLAEVVVPRLRAANPEAVLIGNGISFPGLTTTWIDSFLKDQRYQILDGIAAHPYVWHSKSDWRPEAAITLLEKLSQRAYTKNGQRMPIYVTEFGYPDFDDRLGTSPELNAQYLRRFMLMASSRPWIAGVWWYCIRDQGTDHRNKEHGFGLFDQQLRPKPAAIVFKEISPHINSAIRGQVQQQQDSFSYQSSNGLLKFNWQPEDVSVKRNTASAPK